MTIWFVLAGALVLGIVLLLAGVRGRRIDEHPVCRSCCFDLIGIYPAAAQCPECGAKLQNPRALRRGNRRKQPRLIFAGAALLLPALLGAAAVLTAAVAGYDLNRIKPVPWLLYELRAADLTTSDAAIAELTRRLKGGDLENATTSRVIDIMLDRQAVWTTQADPRDPPMQAWFDFFDLASAKRLVASEQLVRAVQQSLRVQPRSRSHTPSGSTLVVESTVEFLPFSTSDYGTLVMDVTFTVAGRDLKTKYPSVTHTKEVRGLGQTWFYHRPAIDLSPGEYEIEIVYDTELHETGYDPSAARDNPPSPRAAWTLTRRIPIRVTEPGPVVVDLVHDPVIGEQIARMTLRNNEVRFEQRIGNRARLSGVLDCTGCPIDLFCQVIVRSGDQEFVAGDFQWWTVRNWSAVTLTLWDEGQITTDTIDIILKPAPQAAITNTIFDRIWGEPIIFRNVKVIGLDGSPAQKEDAVK